MRSQLTFATHILKCAANTDIEMGFMVLLPYVFNFLSEKCCLISISKMMKRDKMCQTLVYSIKQNLCHRNEKDDLSVSQFAKF